MKTKCVFLLGAGFNADVTAEVGPIYGYSIHIGKHQIQCTYPLLADLSQICFTNGTLPSNTSIEHLLAEAQASGQQDPLKRLARAIMRADYYLAPKITRQGSNNCYMRFFDRFQKTQFLTFNYDSLVELSLFQRGLWFPEDGYGVPVLADRSGVAQPSDSSKSLVLHLHGAFCLYISDHQFIDHTGSGIEWYEHVSPPCYIFDPDSISNLFRPYLRTMPTFGYEPIENRVIAPLPDKTIGLQKVFIDRIYQRAKDLIKGADVVIAIGYGFGATDEESYIPLLSALKHQKSPRLVIVDPMANSIGDRLQHHFPRTNVCAFDLTLKQWVERDCPLFQ